MEATFERPPGWKSQEHTVLDGRFEVGELLQQAGDHAFFRVRVNGQSEALLLRCEAQGQPQSSVRLARFREATFFHHPNVVRVMAAGEVERDGEQLNYVVTEMAEIDLAEATQQKSLSALEMRELVTQTVAGLRYLHDENFVYCGLRAGSVWRVRDQWKLADFSQIRVAGKYPASETRRLLVMPGYECPPEANEGSVVEAWDSWSLASMIRKMLLQPMLEQEIQAGKARPGSSSKIAIPAPYDRLLLEGLEPDPSARASLDRMLAIVSLAATDSFQADTPAPRADTQYKEPAPAPQIPDAPLRSRVWIQPAAPATTDKRQVAILASTFLVLGLLSVLFLRTTPAQLAADKKPNTRAQVHPSEGAGNSIVERRPNPFGDAPVAPANSTDKAKAAASAILKRWANSTRNRDVAGTVSCYAPTVDRLYGQRSVSLQRLQAYEQNVYSRIGTVQKFELTNVRFGSVTPHRVVVSFDKLWEFGKPVHFAGSAREEMTIDQAHGSWGIREQLETKVYWVRRAGSAPEFSSEARGGRPVRVEP